MGITPIKIIKMAWIDTGNDLPGIRSLMAYRPDTAEALNALAEVLLRKDEGLSKGERELLATYVSALNGCHFCQRIHGAVATYYCGEELTLQIRNNIIDDNISPRMVWLFRLAAAVQQLERSNIQDIIFLARQAGITDIEIHDTVLIAAAFCMFNRYVDGLGTFAPDDPDMYTARAKKIAEDTGYQLSKPS